MPRKGLQLIVIVAAALTVGAAGTWLVIKHTAANSALQEQQSAQFLPADVGPQTEPIPVEPAEPVAAAPVVEPVVAPIVAPVVEPAPTSAPVSVAASAPASGPAASPTAQAAMEKGLALLQQGKLIDARTMLSEALLSAELDQASEKLVLAELEKLAQRTIFSGQLVEDDPYTFYHVVESGDVLARLERRLELRIPWQLILKMNGLSRAEDIRAGQRIKLVRGPFHAVVSKSRFMLDIYIQRDNMPRTWVARVPCGLGKDGSTPVGMWKVGKDFIDGNVTPGGKLIRPTWNPPPSSELRGPIKYGQNGYALGDKGLWIGLVGIDTETVNKTDYGIHSTSDQDSIGKEESLGCIRLADKDIELVFSLLYEVWSTVQTKP